MTFFNTRFLLTGSLLLTVLSAQAQVSFSIGPRLGLNVSTYHFSESNSAFRLKYRAGFEAGVMSSVGFGHWALQPALLYSQKGFMESVSVDIRNSNNIPISSGEFQYSNRLHYLTLPVNVAYTQHADGQGFQVFAGPYLGLLLGGRYESTIVGTSATDSGKITPVANDAPDFGNFARRFDVGLQAGVGYRYQALLLQLNYSMGLRDIAARFDFYGGPFGNRAYYNRAFQASLSYLAGPRQ
ncbi:porin family protein [Hymenobacter negativus]|uniref:PorT family protein n=1 Tax=Hymenobacter negativus TaxID=2795026 RepID=A0ABS3Q8Q5_9BACT|nr:porin family protein [Hymenobacter negativus]MBO2007625.1 PorT family protein [Hymenobacter negativus]